MSLGSDYLDEYAFERDYPHGVNGDEWRDARGVIHKLKDMPESYIKNVMRYIDEDDDFWYACKAELNRRLDYDRRRIGGNNNG